MSRAAIKGSALETAALDLRALLEEGRVSRAQLEETLKAEDLALIDDAVFASSWYPMGSYERMLAVLIAHEGADDPDAYLVERGRRSAERLYQAGLYSQLQATVERWGERFGPLMGTLGQAMFRDTRWRLEPDSAGDGGYRIEASTPPDFPDCARLAAQGFIERLGCYAAGVPIRVSSERPSSTLLVFRTDRA